MASRHKPVIGLAGGVGAGKSLVARELARLGCAVIDSDELAQHALDEPEVRDRLVQWWGVAVLDAQGRVDRQAVAAIVFNDPQHLHRLEDLVHPLVHAARARLRARYQADPSVPAIVEDCPLLFEVGLDSQCDHVIFVHTSREKRLERLAAARGWRETDLARREENQMPLDKKARLADYVVANNAGQAECRAQVRRVFSQIIPQPT